ncbi:hypothetical protein [Brachybacterium sp.]|uniref:hypothetical protein n=1 Tax=Brachybacterium sp. TaxID=1891286 RepID=UPI002ED517C5
MITIGHAQQNRQTYLALNTTARRTLGDPKAVTLAWDPENLLLLVSAASPNDPDSYGITESSGRCSVTAIMRDLGLTPAEAHAMPARKHGPTGLVVDVSGIRTRSIRRAA